MEENKHVDELDVFMKKYVNEIESEMPSIDFTTNIMNTIHTLESKEVFKVKPLISGKTWFVLGLILIVSILFVSQGQSISELITIPEVSRFSSFEIPNISLGITVSNTMLYTCLLFSIMAFVQIYLLKGYFSRRLD
ncbi:hypothetical protein SAMN04489761_0766 [Tenacibaculum sp. MAR_2009_124]|uniref:hypothetical protein n=1 Tax=Tenacibaculum sp. MAR_2009_124 TaxID=1250059 RepID=UPI00089C4C48|nr:hypothetical protein [Tenacibaculum sp. MAR_2009_124]SEB44620.1 hypothetical protein SAMN04489761_0766 [Tenacibaculum sp. MAR_2009_124]